MKHRLIGLVTAVLMLAMIPTAAFAGEIGTAAAKQHSSQLAQKKSASAESADTNEIFYVKGTDGYAECSKVLTIVNKERKAQGLTALKMDQELQKAAMQRAAEAALYFSHTRPDGTMCDTISEKVWGENIAAGQTSAKDVMESWMNSSGHRSNILGANYTSIGIGCFTQGRVKYWVQVFGVETASGTVSTKDKTVTHKVQAEPGLLTAYLAPLSVKGVLTGKTTRLSVYTMEGFGSVTVENKSLNWTSSKPSVASVSKTGVVTGKKQGTVTITGKLPVSGQKITTKIKVYTQPKISGLKVKAGKKQLTVSWKKTTKATGYQVTYATNSKFTKNKKSVTISKNKTTKKVIKKLKSKKTYYVKARAYKKVNGTKLYGSYSAVKKIKVK